MLIRYCERRRFAMGRHAVGLRGDFDGKALRRLARASKDASQARRLLALAAVYDGSSRSEAARIGDVSLQTVRDWALRFNEQGPDGLIDGKAPGPSSKLNDEQRRALKEIVEQGPIPAVHGVVRRRLIDLAQWLSDEFGVSLSETTMSREMRALGLRKLSARPRHHEQNELAVEAFKKTSPPRWRKSGRASIPA
jgi:transposase